MRYTARMRSLLVLSGIVLLSSCVHGREGFVRLDGLKRASYEMNCPVESLSTTEINSTTVGVEGCGKKVVYKLVQTAAAGSMDWVRD